MTDWEQVKSAVQLSMTQGSAEGRDALLACWRATAHGDHAYRCVIAHYLADLQSSLDDEVAWDQRALVEHAFLTDEDLAPVGINSTADMAPSLHLNLGDGYLRQGRLRDARAQLEAGQRASSRLPSEGYGAMIRSGLDRLGVRVQEAETR